MSDDARFTELGATRSAVWTLLEDGVANRTSPARLPVLATVGRDGAEARIVVLRGIDRAAETLTIHTDSQSSKTVELAAEPRATLLIWDAGWCFQVRLRVTIAIAPGTKNEWQAIPAGARDVYGGAPMPGETIPAPEAFEPSPDRARLAVLTARVREIETLHLGNVHRRAVFTGKDARWIAP